MNRKSRSPSSLTRLKDTRTKVVNHPKWTWVGGLLIHPEYKTNQKIRTYGDTTYEGWLPDLSDKATLSYLFHLFIEAGGHISLKKNVYTLNEKHTSKDLSKIICEALLDVWSS